MSKRVSKTRRKGKNQGLKARGTRRAEVTYRLPYNINAGNISLNRTTDVTRWALSCGWSLLKFVGLHSVRLIRLAVRFGATLLAQKKLYDRTWIR